MPRRLHSTTSQHATCPQRRRKLTCTGTNCMRKPNICTASAWQLSTSRAPFERVTWPTQQPSLPPTTHPRNSSKTCPSLPTTCEKSSLALKQHGIWRQGEGTAQRQARCILVSPWGLSLGSSRGEGAPTSGIVGRHPHACHPHGKTQPLPAETPTTMLHLCLASVQPKPRG